MKKTMMALVAASFLAAQVPAMAMAHGMQHDAECAKKCEMMVKNCGQESDSIQQRIGRLKEAIGKGSDKYSAEELQALKAQLKDAEATLASLMSAGA